MLGTLVVLLLLVALPLLLVAGLLKLAWFLLLLPFRVVGAVLKAATGLVFGIGALLAAILAIVILPLSPLLLVLFFVWLLVRPRPRLATMT